MKKIASQNLQDIFSIMENIKFQRDPSNLLEFVINTDFFISPASSNPNHHGAFWGGLYEHSKRTFFILKKMNEILPEEKRYSDETLFICGFFHDIAKADTYHVIKKWRKDENNKWEQYDGWEVKDSFPCGHGTKSIILINKYFPLTEEEMLAIRYHMGSYMETDNYSAYIMNNARKITPLVYMVHSSDVLEIDTQFAD